MTYCSDCIAYENGECTMYRERIIEKYRAICFTSKNGMKVDRAEKEKLTFDPDNICCMAIFDATNKLKKEKRAKINVVAELTRSRWQFEIEINVIHKYVIDLYNREQISTKKIAGIYYTWIEDLPEEHFINKMLIEALDKYEIDYEIQE